MDRTIVSIHDLVLRLDDIFNMEVVEEKKCCKESRKDKVPAGEKAILHMHLSVTIQTQTSRRDYQVQRMYLHLLQ